MRIRNYLIALAAIAFVSGCQSPIHGTWKGMSSCCDSGGPITSVSFCPDGTFTAGAKYDGKTATVSGCYKWECGRLTLCMKDSMRRYCCETDGCHLWITHDGKTQTFKRLKGCPEKCGKNRCGPSKCQKSRCCRDECGRDRCDDDRDGCGKSDCCRHGSHGGKKEGCHGGDKPHDGHGDAQKMHPST